jgi:predicted nucleic acid-binding protein
VTFFDTSVVLDILGDDPVWGDWSTEALVVSAAPRRIAPVVYAELSGRFETRSGLDRELAQLGLVVEDARRDALFSAGRAHAAYRRRGGARTQVLPDFLIGAQAADQGASLVTRDPRRLRDAFPDLKLITP